MSYDHFPTLYECALNFCWFTSKLVPPRRRLLLKNPFFKDRYQQIKKKFQNQNHKTNYLKVGKCVYIGEFFCADKKHPGQPKKNPIPIAPLQKCSKNCIFSLFRHFLAFLDSLDTLWNYNLATLAYNLPPEKNRRFWEQNVSRTMILVVGSKVLPKSHCMLKAKKLSFIFLKRPFQTAVQTEPKEPQIYWTYTGIRARSHAFFVIFNFRKKKHFLCLPTV